MPPSYGADGSLNQGADKRAPARGLAVFSDGFCKKPVGLVHGQVKTDGGEKTDQVCVSEHGMKGPWGSVAYVT